MRPDARRRALYERGGVARSCLAKRRFSDELTARAAAQIECDHKSAPLGAMWVYPCENCRGWHMTTKKGGSKRRVTSAHLYPPSDGHDYSDATAPQFGLAEIDNQPRRAA